MKTNIEVIENLKNWSDIDWVKVDSVVKKLRRRIFNARKSNSIRRLRLLQRLMLYSSSNILQSIRKLSCNSYIKTIVIDGKTLESPEERLKLYRKMVKNKSCDQYSNSTSSVYMKELTKMCLVGIPTIYNELIQSMIQNSLEPEFEATFEENYGFKTDENANDVVTRLWLLLNKEKSRKWIINSDIVNCFNTTSHNYLIKHLKGFPGLGLIKKMLKSGIIAKEICLAAEEVELSQKSSLSRLFCNIIINDLEKELNVFYGKKYNSSKKSISIVKFANALVVLCYTKSDALLALEEFKQAILRRELKVLEARMRIVHITEGFDFLGYNIRMSPKPYISEKFAIIKLNEDNYKIDFKNVGIYVTPSNKSIIKVKTKLKEVQFKMSTHTAYDFIKKANPIIKEYAQSKMYWHSDRTFYHLDYYLFILCWRWAIRKHSNKTSSWIRKKYFKNVRLGTINSGSVFTSLKEKNENTLISKNVYLLKFRWFLVRDLLVRSIDKLPNSKKN